MEFKIFQYLCNAGGDTNTTVLRSSCSLLCYLSEMKHSTSFLPQRCSASMFSITRIYHLIYNSAPRCVEKHRVFHHFVVLFRRLISAHVRPLHQMTLAFLAAANPKSPPGLLTGREANRAFVTRIYKHYHPNARSGIYLCVSDQNISAWPRFWFYARCVR